MKKGEGSNKKNFMSRILWNLNFHLVSMENVRGESRYFREKVPLF